MKKIFTFLFCLSLFTASFAQSDRHAEYRGQNNGGAGQPSQNSTGNEYNKNSQSHDQTSFNNQKNDNKGGQFNKDNNDRNQQFSNKGTDWNRDKGRNDDRQYGYDKRNDRDWNNRNQSHYYNERVVVVKKPSLLRIVLGMLL